MSADIFISYRRDDARSEARSIYERLVRKFGHRRVFMDVEGIQHGGNFPEILREKLSKAKFLLAVIGPHWVSGRDPNETNRLHDPNDFVRLEIASALERRITVIPLLVNGARMPTAAMLPQALQPLLSKNAGIVTFENFATDLERIERLLASKIRPFQPVLRGISLVLGFACIGAMMYWLASRTEQTNRPFVSIGDFAVEPQGDQDLMWRKDQGGKELRRLFR